MYVDINGEQVYKPREEVAKIHGYPSVHVNVFLETQSSFIKLQQKIWEARDWAQRNLPDYDWVMFYGQFYFTHDHQAVTFKLALS